MRRLWAKISALFGKKNEGSGINSDMRAVTTFTVYNQKVYEGENKLYIGEDALPYADEEILLVADGLGGRGGYAHTEVNRNIVYRDGFYDLVFAPVFGDVEEGFKKYLLKSFTEVFETQDYYFTDRNAAKTSGYFASRLAAAIVVYELKYAEGRKSVDELLSDPRGVETARCEYAEHIKDELCKKMSSIAANLSLVNESKVCGANLLPTTLHAALYKENAETVDVIYFWAGDSRAYAWDEDGLAQITAEHEKAEVMTNLVNLTEDFVIESRHVTFTKPCALFSVTDGCYKCGAFFTPLHFEWSFLKATEGASDAADAAEKLKQLFAEKGQHDDSNTMALALFGYDGFDGFKKAAKARLGVISSEIIEKLPDIMERDYESETDEARVETERIVFSRGAGWIELPEVRMYIVERMRLEKDKKFLETEAAYKRGATETASVGAQTETSGEPATNENAEEGAAKTEKEVCTPGKEKAESDATKSADKPQRRNAIMLRIKKRFKKIKKWFKKKCRNSVAKDTYSSRFAGEGDATAEKAQPEAGEQVKITYVEMETVGDDAGGVILKACPSGGAAVETVADGKESKAPGVSESEASELERYESCINRYWRVKKNGVISDIWFEHREILPEDVRVKLEEEAGFAERSYRESKSKDESRQRLLKNYYDAYRRYYKESQI